MMTNEELRRINNFESSINYKFAIILFIIVIGIASNAVRSYLDIKDSGKQRRIEYLDKRVASLEAKLEACESGTPMPRIKE